MTVSCGRGQGPGSSPGRVEGAVRLRMGLSHLKLSGLERRVSVLLWKELEPTGVS